MKARIVTEAYREAHRKRQKRFMEDPEYRKNSINNLGNTGKTHFKKGRVAWNYIDGRSKSQMWNRYGTDWKQIRKEVLTRDDNQCQICGKFDCRLEVHHKTPFLISRDNSVGNLITLCCKCHRQIESQITRELIKIKITGGDNFGRQR